ncbi:hypothetical protein M422DRAFT_151540 [Sphaerobolus stellatus SS14]|nr:hypothetical protein M422DRAFT_151540 [Sphaerobolus stellatus SS14]
MLTWVLAAVVGYLCIVRFLRYRRINAVIAKYETMARTGGLDPVTAQKILHISSLYDHPVMMFIALLIALFKVYGIESVAKLLLQTGQLKSPEALSKRLNDTGTLIFTWMTNPITMPRERGEPSYVADPRGAIANARVNYLHSKYKIPNEDFLYNLALFISTPIQWITKFDWRPHTELEREASFVFWCEIGRRMGIQNIWKSYSEMEEWTERYEEEYLVPNKAAHSLAELSLNFLLERFPEKYGIRRNIKSIVICFLDDRTRKAMMLPEPHPWLHTAVYWALYMRAFIIRFTHLPRISPSLYVTVDEPPFGKYTTMSDGVPRMRANYRRRPHPWYYGETPNGIARLWEQIQVSLGLIKPENLPGKKWRSEGYRLEELGPAKFEKEGHVEVMEMAARLQGGPVIGPWSLQQWDKRKAE